MASRKEEKERLRQERLQAEAEAQKGTAKKQRALAIAAVIGVVAVVAAVVVVLASGGGGSSEPTADSDGFPAGTAPASAIAITEAKQGELDAALAAAGCEFHDNPDEGRTHEDKKNYKFKYEANPPTSGTHFPQPAADGAYYEDPPKVEELVHSLEHGRVIFQWNKDKVTAAQIGAMKKLFDDEPYHLLLVENQTDMPFAVAASAWNTSMTCDTFNEKTLDAMRTFHLVWADRAPERVP